MIAQEIWFDVRNDIIALVFKSPDRFFPLRLIFWDDEYEYEKGCDDDILARWGFIYVCDL